MAQTGFTPVQLYHSTTAAATPSAGNLAAGELAVNITDGKLFYKDNGGTVRVLAGTGGSGVVAGSNTQVQFNNNGVFGASANMTFNGTRLTVADLADSGLTSGRVVYSTTGGALTDSANLTFDGTSLTSTGPVYVPAVINTSNGTSYFTDASTGNGIYVGGSTASPANTIRLFTNGSEGMRLTSTGLGIGTSSMLGVSDRLAVVGGNIAVQRTSGITTILGDNTQRGYVGTISNHALSFLTNSTEQMFLDSSGNLGLGVTPSAWSGISGAAFELKGNAYQYSTSGVMSLGANAFFNGTNWIYKTTQAASRYEQVNGVHQWFTAPSGTAGNAITFTQAMTLDASGNLGVGVTNPSNFGKLAVRGTIASASPDGTLQSLFTASDTGEIRLGGYKSGGGTYLVFSTGADAERARIDSSGNLLVGTTSTTESATSFGARLYASGLISSANPATTNATTTYNVYSTGSGLYRFYVGLGGTVYATNTTISAISDQRLKENVQDLDIGLDKIMALKPRKFDWKAGKGKDIKGDRGFIAQEFEQVFPDLIDEWKDPAPEGEEPYKSVRQDLIPVLVKAIQEQQAIITAQETALNQLKARLDAANL